MATIRHDSSPSVFRPPSGALADLGNVNGLRQNREARGWDLRGEREPERAPRISGQREDVARFVLAKNGTNGPVSRPFGCLVVPGDAKFDRSQLIVLCCITMCDN